MRKLKYVKLFESFLDEQLMNTDKSKFIDSIISRLENGEDLPFFVSVEETTTKGQPDLYLYVSKVEKEKVNGSADTIRVSGDSLKYMTQDQFEKLYELLPYKGGMKGKNDRWADNTTSSEKQKEDADTAHDRYKEQSS
jgi:hypothetical protein